MSMTERFDLEKAIKIVGLNIRAESADEGRDFDVACRMIVNALEEIQQYRAIGTVEECEKAIDFELAKQDKSLAVVIDEYLEYIKIGTIEEFKALKESKCKYWNAEHEDCTLSYEEIRNKAIGEFAERMKELAVKWFENGKMTIGSIDEIAEEMRGAECIF